jgi:DNA-binding winged helix-turn-helix (wHTH) protein/TolB-like protein/Tfp pilus assembly protein PilF
MDATPTVAGDAHESLQTCLKKLSKTCFDATIPLGLLRMTPAPPLRFDPLLIDPNLRTAFLNGAPVPLTPKAFDLLLYLANHRERVVSKGELMAHLWRDAAVEDANVTQTVFMLRRALRECDPVPHREWIETLPRRGYRFVASADVALTTNEQGGAGLAAPQPAGPEQPRRWHSFRALRLPAFVVAVCSLLALSGPGGARPVAGLASDVTSVAVLPLTLAGNTERYVADGITDELVRYLARVRQVRVVARQASQRVTDEHLDVQDVGRRLRVEAVLTGRASSTAGLVHVEARLLRTSDARELWASRYQAPLLESIGSRGLAFRIADDLIAAAWEDEARPPQTPHHREAYVPYLRGRYYLGQRTVPALATAQAQFTAALGIDWTFAEAHAGLGDVHLLLGIFGGAPARQSFVEAKKAALTALQLDPANAEAHTTLGFVKELLEKDWAGAEAAFRRAIALNPNHAQAHHWYALLLNSTLRHREAVREIETAIALDPLSPVLNSDFAMILAHNGQYDQAIAHFRRTIALAPLYADAYQELGWALAFSGRADEAIAVFNDALRKGVMPAAVSAGIGFAHAQARRRDQAMQEIRNISRTAVPGTAERLEALVRLGLGDHDRALELLLEACPDGDPNLLVGRIYDPVRGDPRFQELLRRSGLASLSSAANLER